MFLGSFAFHHHALSRLVSFVVHHDPLSGCLTHVVSGCDRRPRQRYSLYSPAIAYRLAPGRAPESGDSPRGPSLKRRTATAQIPKNYTLSHRH